MNPYTIDGPALISFSGGRTSGYMLRQILDAHGGALPDNIHVVFANTGKEMPETLDFVQECGDRWGVKINWLEWCDKAKTGEAYEVVNHNSASRDGEPFRALINKKGYLPNPVARLCTENMKVKPMQHFMKAHHPREGWANVVGLRFDEPRRVANLKNAKLSNGCDENLTPLSDAKVTKDVVKAFWDSQDFDLQLENVNGVTPLGNCDLCFLKGATTLGGIIRDRPELAEWWIDIESTPRNSNPDGATFRSDRPRYSRMLEMAKSQGDLFSSTTDDSTIPCMCTD